MEKDPSEKVKASPTIFKQKIVAVKTQALMPGAEWVALRENEAINVLGGGVYVGGGKRMSKLRMPKVVSIMDIFKEELIAVAPGVQCSGKKITDFKKLLSIAISAVEHLENIHKQGFIHRDINGRNIMLTGKGQARLIDFGLALDLRNANPRKTPAGINCIFNFDAGPMGTPQFMAPEIKSYKQYSDRSDIYALGIVFSEELCLTRFAPPEMRTEINNFMIQMKDPDLNKRPSAEKVYLFLNDVQHKLGAYEAKKIEKINIKEAIDNLISIIKRENLGVELKEENGNINITIKELNCTFLMMASKRLEILDILKKLGNEPDGTKLLSVDYELNGNLTIIKGEWIYEMSKVLQRHAKDKASTSSLDDAPSQASITLKL